MIRKSKCSWVQHLLSKVGGHLYSELYRGKIQRNQHRYLIAWIYQTIQIHMYLGTLFSPLIIVYHLVILVWEERAWEGGTRSRALACLPLLLNSSLDQCTSLHWAALCYTALSCTTLHSTELYYATLHWATLHWAAIHWATLHYTTLSYTTLSCNTLSYTTLHCTELHYTELHYTDLHYTELHYTELHNTTLHYTVRISRSAPVTTGVFLDMKGSNIRCWHCTCLSVDPIYSKL